MFPVGLDCDNLYGWLGRASHGGTMNVGPKYRKNKGMGRHCDLGMVAFTTGILLYCHLDGLTPSLGIMGHELK